MTTSVSWTVNADGDFDTAANWSTGAVPNSADVVTIATSTFHTITHNSGADTVDKLTVGNDLFELNGGSLNVLTAASFADGFEQTGGVLSAATVALHKGTLTGGSVTGTTVITEAGTAVIGNYTIGGSATFTDTAVTNQTGAITVGDSTGANAHIKIGAAGHYNIAGDYGINSGSASATLVNAGLLAKTNGSATSAVGIDVVSTGTLSAAAGGTLELDGNANMAGATAGACTLAPAGTGKTTLTVGTVKAATFGLIDGASLTLATNTTISGVLEDAASFNTTTLNLGANTLTVAGTGSSVTGANGTAVITGSGVFANTGSLLVGGTVVGGTATLSNTGTITQGYTVTIGDSSAGLAEIVNKAGGTYDFVQDVGIGIGANTGNLFSNLGTLEKTVSTGTSTIGVVVSNAASATISVATGTLDFTNVLTSNGTITGAGHVELTGAAEATLGAGTSLTVAEFDVLDGSTLTLATSVSYAGIFTEQASFGQTVLGLGGNTLTLSGASNVINGFEGASTISGSGVLANTGTLSVGELTLGGTATLDNTGVVNQVGTFTLGDAAGDTAIVDNGAQATWNLVNANGIDGGASSLATFENFGLLAALPGQGSTVTVESSLVNERGGTITIGSGTLDLTGNYTNAGAVTGGTLQLIDSAAETLTAGTVLTNTEFDVLDNATLTLGLNETYKGSFTDGANFGGATVDLAGHLLTLTGSAAFTGFEGQAHVTGGGTLTTSGTTQISTLIVGSTSVFDNTGTIQATGGLTVGDGSGAAASFVNAAKGVYDIVSDNAGINLGASMASAFTNNGLFEKTAGTGTNVVSGNFVNDGTITVTSGTIEFTAGTLINNGTINGVVTTDSSGNVFITHH